MKLLLTSNGLSNKSIADALEDLLRKPRKESRIAFIPTAGFVEASDWHNSREWLVNDMNRIKEFCGSIDIVSLADLSKQEVIERLEYADVIFVGGGNVFYLSYMFEKLDLFKELPRLLQTRVYAGISAGSIITGESLRSASGAIENREKFYDEDFDIMGPEGRSVGKSLQFVNFVIRPHFNNKSFPNINGDYLKEIAKDVKVPLYAIDDNSAIKVDGDKIEVISEGSWHKYN